MDDSPDAPNRRAPLPRWTVPLVAVVVLLVGAAALVLLWQWIDGLPIVDAEKKASAHIEALKIASGIVVGGGGLFALYLAARRQRTQELELEARRIELAQRDRVQFHAERVAEDARQDALERRVTELYTKAADQLGSDKAPVRLAGLHALERLGQGNPNHRQTVVDVVCAYLRMPYTAPVNLGGTDSVDEPHSREELQVRKTAQRILANHLSEDPSTGEHSTFWPGIQVDLSGAHLVDFQFINCRLKAVDLNGATLTGEARFSGLRCEFAFMQSAEFHGLADFRGAEFTNSAWMSYATFNGDVWFHRDEFYPRVSFGRHVSFGGAVFRGAVKFEGAVFRGSVDFRGTEWAQGVELIEFANVLIEQPGITSPDVAAAVSSWPQGWRVRITDEVGTLERG